ncbi:MAG: SDR family NAD(P)-dependent oxidoreductase [Spirochaetia bacterium]
MTDIKGKWALITGASRGVGRQLALGLAAKGCNLVLHSRTVSHTAELSAELKKSGITVHELEADLTDTEAARRLAEKAEETSGGIDILYNNAAIMSPWHDPFTAPPEDYHKSFTVNVISLIVICDVIVPRMQKRGFGRVINVTSGIQDQPELTPYAISKAAVDKYVKDLAGHLSGTGVVMSLLDPGWLRTDLGGQNAPNAVESVLPGALVPALLENDAASGILYRAQEYR